MTTGESVVYIMYLMAPFNKQEPLSCLLVLTFLVFQEKNGNKMQPNLQSNFRIRLLFLVTRTRAHPEAHSKVSCK